MIIIHRFYSRIYFKGEKTSSELLCTVTTATVERTLKLVKTNLRNRLQETMLDWCMRIAIEGPDALSKEDITAIVEREKKWTLVI